MVSGHGPATHMTLTPDLLLQYPGWHDRVQLPAVAIADIHELDQAHDVAGAAEMPQQVDHRSEERGVAHAPRDLAEVGAVEVVRAQVLQDLVGRAVLRDVLPRGCVDARRPGHHPQGDGVGEHHQLARAA